MISPSLLLLATSLLGFQDLGERTTSPEALLRDFGSADIDDGMEEAVAAAAAHPLGTLANPVRVGGPDGVRAYVARLRCGDGRAPVAGEARRGGVGAFGTVVDVVELDCGKAAPGSVELVTDIYHEEHRETTAPAGFTIID